MSKELSIYVRRNLLRWGDKHFQNFPWRGELNPFRALVAEILLQRTRAEQVVPVFLNFKQLFPDTETLVTASVHDIENAIKPLGLRWRAKFLYQLGVMITQNGIPSDFALLQNFPGVGRYTASAYLSLHTEKRMPIVDSNVVRFYGRFFGFDVGSETRRNKKVLEIADLLTPKREFKRFNYALLDFTRAICTTRPNHRCCSVRKKCAFWNNHVCDI